MPSPSMKIATVSTLYQIITKQLHFPHMENILIEKKYIFERLASEAMLLAMFRAGTGKSLSDFRPSWGPPLLTFYTH